MSWGEVRTRTPEQWRVEDLERHYSEVTRMLLETRKRLQFAVTALRIAGSWEAAADLQQFLDNPLGYVDA